MTAALTGTAAILTAALSQIGVPYSWGGEDPGTDFDCSGLVQWAYEQAGIQLPRTSEAQFQATTQIPESQAKPGDLVFMAGSDGTAANPGHVGIFLGGGKFLEAPHTGANVEISTIPTGATFGAVQGLPENASSAPTSVLSAIDTTATSASPGGGGGILSTVTSALDPLSGLGNVEQVFTDLVNPAFWKRTGMGIGGVALFIVGLVIFFESTDVGKKATSDLTSAAGAAAVA